MRKAKPSFTAMVVAFWRALADLGLTSVPGFSDPLARQLLPGPIWQFLLRRAGPLAANPQWRASAGLRPHLDALILRVAFIDELIARSAAPQVVILGAGLDTRAWRLQSLRGARVFEVDHPATQAFKREQAAHLPAPLADLRYVAVDFTRDDLARALDAAGCDATLPTVWVWEGVIMYLDDAALRGTLAVLRRRWSRGSVLAAHYHEPESGRPQRLLRGQLFRWLGEAQIGTRSRSVMKSELERAGFEVVEDAGLPEQAARVGAPSPAADITLKVSRISVARAG